MSSCNSCGCNSSTETNDPNRIVCNCMSVSYLDIRKAMINGARTVEEIGEQTGAGTACGSCIPEIEEILENACSCKNVSMDTVINAVQNGADTVEKIGEQTGAGTGCGRCKPLLQNVIDNKK